MCMEAKAETLQTAETRQLEDETKISFAWKFAKEVLNENILAQKAGWNANILQKLFYNSSYIIYSDSILFEVSAVAAN